MIWVDTVFYIFDRPIITFFYKKKYSVKIRVIRLVCVLYFTRYSFVHPDLSKINDLW
jgi:O-antigen/teichoic acid export membrane protein